MCLMVVICVARMTYKYTIKFFNDKTIYLQERTWNTIQPYSYVVDGRNPIIYKSTFQEQGRRSGTRA